jgi:hypothetical protein
MEFKWTVEKLVVTTGNIVTQVYWRCDAIQEDLMASCSGVRELVLGDTFVPYEQLTEAQVLDWCFADEVITAVNPRDYTTTTIVKLVKNEAESQVAEQINKKILQKTAEPALPWA